LWPSAMRGRHLGGDLSLPLRGRGGSLGARWRDRHRSRWLVASRSTGWHRTRRPWCHRLEFYVCGFLLGRRRGIRGVEEPVIVGRHRYLSLLSSAAAHEVGEHHGDVHAHHRASSAIRTIQRCRC
jgi:hypothetical protein